MEYSATRPMRWYVSIMRYGVHLLLLALGIKNFIVSLIIKYSSAEESLKGQKIFINKLNLILVQVLAMVGRR